MKRYYSLDIVRGFAALSVLLTHWGGWTISFADDMTAELIYIYQKTFAVLFWGGGGIHPGVIIFIVLSGFCIHLSQALDPEKLKKPGFWKRFYLRRSFRILPVFWAALLLGVISIWLIGNAKFGQDNQDINQNLLFTILGVSEISRYFGATNLYPGNGPLQTVAVEILLYASYPLFLLIYQHKGLSALLAFGLILYFCIAFLRLLGVDPNLLQGTYFEFVIYWIIGAVSAGQYAKATLDYDRYHDNLGTLVVIGYISYLVLTNFINIKGFYVFTSLLLAALTGVALIFFLSLESALKKQKTKIFECLAMLGARSYSLYVVHTPVIFITLWYFSSHTSLAPSYYPLLALLAVFGSTEIIFRLIEMPSLRYLKT